MKEAVLSRAKVTGADISCQISREFAPWMPLPVLHHAPVTTIFTYFLVINLHLFKKTGPLDAPRMDAPRVDARAVAPSAPPLHATVQNIPTCTCSFGNRFTCIN